MRVPGLSYAPLSSEHPFSPEDLSDEVRIQCSCPAPWYHPSEIILGHALSLLEPEFPRSSYKIITKVGKYGPVAKDHTFEPDVVKKSVQRSLRRLKTDYLDAVCMSCPLSHLSCVPPAAR